MACIALTIFFQSAAAHAERPVAAVIAFEAKGISRAEADILTDLFSYNLTRGGRFIVAGRQESGRIIDSLDMPPMDRSADDYFFYIGDFLYADLLFAGTITKSGAGLSWRMSLYAPEGKKKLAEREMLSADMDGLYRSCPDMLRDILDAAPGGFGRSLVTKYETALAPFTVKQRILFVFPDGELDSRTALARETMSSLFAGALSSDEILPLYTEYSWNVADEASLPIAALAKRFDAHRIFYIGKKGEVPLVKAVDAQGISLATFPSGPKPISDAGAALSLLKDNLPPLPQEIVARELSAINEVNGKLSAILSERRILSKPFALNITQKLVKTVGHPSFQPNLNFVAADASFLWYYNKLLGAGLGYGVSVGYPGTLDNRISGHPPFLQHEVRLYPISFRIPGTSGILANGFVSFNTHNASKVTFYLAEETTYTDSRAVYFSRVGIELGYFINLSENTALTLNAITLAYCIPLSMGPNFQNDRSFCGDLGGVGLMIRF